MTRKPLPIKPKALIGELNDAIGQLERTLEYFESPLSWGEALLWFRNPERRIEAMALQLAGGKLDAKEAIILDAAHLVHKAFERIDRFEPAGYLTVGVESALQSRRSKKRGQAKAKPRASADSTGLSSRVIGQWLQGQGYATSRDKQTLIDRAIVRFDSNETDIRQAAREAGLTRSYRRP